ncbi:ExeM/NucH family extracellular endonuclease [Curtobacterium sp. PhB136]|uniref:ExeM/NucH family extracellular endonuclease n=1 Tax=Curtobacterium sp. PhB136 TaxID=2485181 RepID=UPI0010490986|nr:ExeM/NucH family extracellular endonuclease [Curtobacterium sp. PhB136]TCK66292.1 putative extracellular nuclease [Curtobacterium sp. PhB136]
MQQHVGRTLLCATVAATFLAAPLVTVTAASANTTGTGLVIQEAYVKGGSAGAFSAQKFVEIGNPTDAPVDLGTWSLQYRPPATGSNVSAAPLSGTVPAHGTYLVQLGSNGANARYDLPTPDATLGLNPGGGGGVLVLADQTAAVALPAGSVTDTTEGVVDLLGWGTATTFESDVAVAGTANSVPDAFVRAGSTDTDDNAADFTKTQELTPTNAAGETATPIETTPTEPTEPAGPAEPVTIGQLQGTTDTSPYAGKNVVTTGVVTAVYATGGFNGYTVQTPGTGGALDLAAHTASDAVFVYSPATVASVHEGDHLELTGAVSEYKGLTELTVTSAADVTTLAGAVPAPQPAAVAFPSTDVQRESLESMLVAPQGDYTVADNYTTNQYGEVVLASGTKRLLQPTEVARPGSAAAKAVEADNAARKVTLDDGASTNFLPYDGSDQSARSIPVPWLTNDAPVTVGAATTFTKPVVLDYRNGGWAFQPTAPITGATATTDLPATFSNVRTAEPADVGGDLKLAGFNVLNYFPTTGDQLTGCTYYTDRAGDPVTVNSGCDARGAAEEEDFQRQQAKIVTAINGLGADVVSLEEIENSARFGEDRDAAVATLVGSLNAATGTDTWAYVKSPAVVPASEDVIRLALIYKQARVAPTGASTILLDDAFTNARQPVADAFRPVGGSADDEFLVIANHFKSKGSGTGENADQGDGQGASNADRVRQATALAAFSTTMQQQYGTDKVFMLGDFNAYSQEDPMVVLGDAGYTDLGPALDSSEWSYVFSGLSGSLDHVLASPAALASVTGVDIWNINSTESVALEYSRFNYNASNLYTDDVYRASDHDPILVGFDLADGSTDPTDPTDPGTDPGTDPTDPGADPSEPGTSPASLSVSGDLRVGGTFTLTGSGFAADERTRVELHSDPVLLGTVVADADGDLSGRLTIPASVSAGTHTIVVTGPTTGTVTLRVTIDPATGAASVGALAFTGAELGGGIAAALLLLAAGAGVLVVRRRRAA